MITKNYIKMCEKAEEIQREWKPDIGDIHYYKNDIKLIALGETINNVEKNKYYCCWLPTQEQVQEMIYKEYSPIFKIEEFRKYISQFEKIYWFTLNPNEISMNELWLAFVIKERWNKIWTGKEWTKYE